MQMSLIRKTAAIFGFKSERKYPLFLLIFLLGLAFRLWGITNPLLDFHSWRQTDTAAIARNFYLNGMNILQPRLDVLPGYEELGFPLYSYVVAILYLFFGIHEILGRLVSIIFSLGSMWYLYLLAEKYFNHWVGLIAILFFSILPMSVYYTRTFQPESMMLFFSITGLYFFSEWIDGERWKHFIIAAISLSCALLIKIPTLYIGFPLAFYSALKYKRDILSKWKLFLLICLVLFPTILWYWYDHRSFLESGGHGSIWELGADKWANKDVLLGWDFYRHIFLNRVPEKLFAFTGIPFLLLGLFSQVEKREQYLFHVWFMGIVIYFLVIANGNYFHEYYQLPMIPIGSIFIAKAIYLYFCTHINGKYRGRWMTCLIVAFILFVPIYSIRKINSRLKLNTNYLKIASVVKSYSQNSEKIVVLGRGRPEVIYYSERKGWHTGNLTTTTLEYYREKGAAFLVISDVDLLNNELNVYLEREYAVLYRGQEGILVGLKV